MIFNPIYDFYLLIALSIILTIIFRFIIDYRILRKIHKSRIPIRESEDIYKFKKGDVITRLKASSNGDNSYRGDLLTFIAIKNNCIYYKTMHGWSSNPIAHLPLERWSYGWGLYETPEIKSEIKSEKTFINKMKDFYGTLQHKINNILDTIRRGLISAGDSMVSAYKE